MHYILNKKELLIPIGHCLSWHICHFQWCTTQVKTAWIAVSYPAFALIYGILLSAFQTIY